MTLRDRVFDAAQRLAQDQPLNQISLTDIAREAGVSWPTARRYIGNKQQLREFLSKAQPDAEPPLDTRSRILESAKRVFAQSGYAGATLDAIAADAELTKGAVYWHFSSKSDLFLALLEDQLQSPLNVSADRAKAAFDQNAPRDAVRSLLAGQLTYAQAHPDWCRLYMEFMIQSRQSDVQEVLSVTTCQQQEEAIDQLIRQMQRDGIIAADVDPQVIAMFWGALVDGLILAHMVDPERVDPAACVDQLVRLLWQGLQAGKSER